MPLVIKHGRPVKGGEAVCRMGIAQTGTVHSVVPNDDTQVNVMRNNGEVQKWPAIETMLISDLDKTEAEIAAEQAAPAPEPEAAPAK